MSVVPPVASVITAAAAAVSHGPPRVYWTLGAIAATTVTAGYTWKKQDDASTIKIKVATALADAGQVVAAALSAVESAPTREARAGAVDKLGDVIVETARNQCGMGTKGNTRAVFYAKSNGGLVRKWFAGRKAVNTPRRDFIAGRSDHDDEAIKRANGEEHPRERPSEGQAA